MFEEFSTVAELEVDPSSVVSSEPPEPDIAFTVDGKRRFAELVEITDQELAEKVSVSLKTGRITGGAFSQAAPLVAAFQSKSAKTYLTHGAALLLLAYYDKQYPAHSVDPDLIPRSVGAIAARMVDSEVWQRSWVYDSWQKRVLWVYPDDEVPRR